MKSRLLGAVSACATALVLSTSVNAATLLIDSNGELTGAEGVNVGSSLYNISFQDGSCNSLFNGCTEFTFTDYASAGVASQALLDQIFIGVYDTNPEKTNGIEFTDQGFIYTPYGRSRHVSNEVNIRYARNYDTVDSDVISQSQGRAFDEDYTSVSYVTYAVWTQASVVPVPAAAWLFGSGLLGLIGIARRKKA